MSIVAEAKKDLMNLIRGIRAIIFRTFLRKRDYYLFSTDHISKRSMAGISQKFGFDRGTPIDRYYIEKFVSDNSDAIKGKCLEITDNFYTKQFGGNKVTHSDALDIDKNNKSATIYGDLRNLEGIKDNQYDCLIVTHTISIIDDYEAAIKECIRILKPGGTLLATFSCICPVLERDNYYWRFTEASTKYVFGKYEKQENIEVKTYGNALVGQAFWLGFSIQDLTFKELAYNDPTYPIIVSVKLVKGSK